MAYRSDGSFYDARKLTHEERARLRGAARRRAVRAGGNPDLWGRVEIRGLWAPPELIPIIRAFVDRQNRAYNASPALHGGQGTTDQNRDFVYSDESSNPLGPSRHD